MTVDNAIHIDAPPSVVWAVTEDIERWPETTPTITAVTRLDGGPFGVGSTARLKQPGQPESVWTVTEFEHGERFAWETRRLGLRMMGSHWVEPALAGTTNHLRVEASGVVAVLFWPVLRVLMRYALAQENRGLKARCEAIARSHAPSPSA